MDPATVMAAIALAQQLIKFIDENSGGQKATLDDLRAKTPDEILAAIQAVPKPVVPPVSN